MEKATPILIDESLPWPDEVPVLRAKDMHQGDWEQGKCRCLDQWIRIVFPFPVWADARSVVLQAAGQTGSCATDVWDLNDGFGEDNRPPKKRLATIWNTAMKTLGYTETYTPQKWKW